MDFGFTRVRDRVRFLHCLIGLFQQSTGVIKERNVRRSSGWPTLRCSQTIGTRSHPQGRESAGEAPVGRREVSMRHARHFPFPRPPRSSADAEAPQRFSITAQDAEARNILFAESGISFCLAKRTSLRYWNFYETYSRNVARRRCAVPDGALDCRLAGREGRFARSCAESARHFCEAYWPPLYTFLCRRGYSPGCARYRPGFFQHLLEQNICEMTK